MTRFAVRGRNQALLHWYGAHKRDLPWRDTGDPYATLVSEVMLQQTQVDRVIPRFESFMTRFPTVHDLAAAQRIDVLEEWSGLGYNSRAVRLHEAAAVVSTNGWPEDLTTLPGVGPYTASAIGSMAFGRNEPAVDTNLRRVLSRWIGVPLEGRELREAANELVGHPAGDWNQALMDLGSSLCRPRNPLCAECPVSAHCADPTIYAPPRPQGAFEGSRRELRGALVRAHVAGADPREAGARLGRSDNEVEEVIDDLVAEGLLPA